MDAIDALDWGVYSHFDFENQRAPGLFPVMQIGYYVSGYVGVGLILLAAVVLFLVQGKRRSALVAIAISFAAVGLIEAVRWLVPRRRPENAVKTLGPDDMLGSYPAASVFLFMLAMILLGFAVWGLTQRALWRGLYVLFAALLTVWVCMSQFFLALHFLTDILGALVGATLIGWIAHRFLEQSTQPVSSAQSALPVATDAIQDLAHAHGIQKK